MGEEGDLGALAGVFEDDTARTILAETSSQPMTVNELADHLEASKPTIYRRIEQLEEHDLLTASIRPATEGPQETVYRATFDRLVIDLEEGTYSYRLERTERMADRLTRFIEQL
jgi:predicted transcriptional regulator